MIGLANVCPLSRNRCSHSPSPRPRAISAPPSPRLHAPSPRPHPLRSRATPTPASSVRTPPPKRGRKRAAAENLHVNPQSLHVKTHKRLGSERLSVSTTTTTTTTKKKWLKSRRSRAAKKNSPYAAKSPLYSQFTRISIFKKPRSVRLFVQEKFLRTKF
jgi:hypothetical protein